MFKRLLIVRHLLYRPSHKSGAVAGLRRVKQAISVARKVLEHTDHTIIVGEWATQFALEMGFKEENLQTVESLKIWKDWKDKACQPNFWKVRFLQMLNCCSSPG